MRKIDYTFDDFSGSIISGNLLLVNLNTRKYYLEKNKYLARYILNKLFIENSYNVENRLDEYMMSILESLKIRKNEKTENYVLYFELTDRCNLRCKHCYNDSNSKDIYTINELSIDNIREVLGGFSEKDNIKVILSGGEPTLYYNLEELMICLSESSTPFAIYTNGICVEKYVADFRRYQCNIIVSLDGASAEEHDYIRGEGNFDKAKCTIDLLKNEVGQEHISIAYTINNHNYQSLENMLELALELDVKRIFINVIAILGRNIDNQLGLNFIQLEYVYNKVYEMKNEFENIEIICDTFWKIDYIKKNKNIPSDCSICKKIRISACGDIYPCTFFEDKKILRENIKQDSFSKIRLENKSKEIGNKLEERLKMNCAECIFTVFCNGGCPANGYENGNWGISETECEAKSRFYESHISRM